MYLKIASYFFCLYFCVYVSLFLLSILIWHSLLLAFLFSLPDLQLTCIGKQKCFLLSYPKPKTQQESNLHLSFRTCLLLLPLIAMWIQNSFQKPQTKNGWAKALIIVKSTLFHNSVFLIGNTNLMIVYTVWFFFNFITLSWWLQCLV